MWKTSFIWNVYIAYSISGERTEKKDKYQLAEIIKYYNEIEENDPNLGEEMKKRGKWIAKDLKKFSRGKRGEWESKYVTVPGDQELLQDMKCSKHLQIF